MYPNTYAVGMSNLGFQTIYSHLNALPNVVCERVFFPDPEDLDEHAPHGDRALLAGVAPPPRRLRPDRLLGDLRGRLHQRGPDCSAWRGFPPRAADRGPGDPVVLMGGVCAFSNPEPVAPFMDLIAVGEGEELVGELVAAWIGARPATMAAASASSTG